LSSAEAHALLALLTLCEEITDFTPGVAEFEARIREERERQLEQNRQAAVVAAATPVPPPVPPKPSMTDTNVMRAAPQRPAMPIGPSHSFVAAPPAQVAEVVPAQAPHPMVSEEEKSLDPGEPVAVAAEAPAPEMKAPPPELPRTTPPAA